MAKKLESREYQAELIKVIDGDTIDCYIDLGFDIKIKKRVRYMGIDTWESRTRDLEEKEKGLAAKQYLIEQLESNDNKFVLVSHGVGKFGRCLGELFLKKDGWSLNEMLITEGHAVKYFGGKR